MLWTFKLSLGVDNLAFFVLATVLATFPKIGRIFPIYFGHPGQYKSLACLIVAIKAITYPDAIYFGTILAQKLLDMLDSDGTE